MIDFFEACRANRSGIANDLGLPFAQTIDRWVRTRRINPTLKKLVLDYFRRKKIAVK